VVLVSRDALRPAFYALGRGGLRDHVTLLRPPYTVWHLSYVGIGAALAPFLVPASPIPIPVWPPYTG
jgi:hypothetical protein